MPHVFRYKPFRGRLAPLITIGVKIEAVWYPVEVYVDSGSAYTVFRAQIADGVGFDYRTGNRVYLQVGVGGDPGPVPNRVYPLLQMSDADLQRESDRTFPSERWAEYEALLGRKRTRPLTSEEETCLDALRREADVLMFRRGYTAVLLKRRGYGLPTLREIEANIAAQGAPFAHRG